MVSTLSRISVLALALAGLAGTADARDAGTSSRDRPVRSSEGFRPTYRADTRVSGPERPYSWPVSDRYRPVSKPYFGRAY